MQSHDDQILKLAEYMAFGGKASGARQYFRDAEAAEITTIQTKYAVARACAIKHQRMWTEEEARRTLMRYLDHLEFCLSRTTFRHIDDVRAKLFQDVERVVAMVCDAPFYKNAIPAVPVVPTGLPLSERLSFFNVPRLMTEEVALTESQLRDVIDLPSDLAYWLVNVQLDTPYEIKDPSVFGRSWLTLVECLSLGACIETDVVLEFAARKEDDARKNMTHVRELAHPSMQALGSRFGISESSDYPSFLLGPQSPEKYEVCARIYSSNPAFRVARSFRPMAVARIG